MQEISQLRSLDQASYIQKRKLVSKLTADLFIGNLAKNASRIARAYGELLRHLDPRVMPAAHRAQILEIYQGSLITKAQCEAIFGQQRVQSTWTQVQAAYGIRAIWDDFDQQPIFHRLGALALFAEARCQDPNPIPEQQVRAIYQGLGEGEGMGLVALGLPYRPLFEALYHLLQVMQPAQSPGQGRELPRLIEGSSSGVYFFPPQRPAIVIKPIHESVGMPGHRGFLRTGVTKSGQVETVLECINDGRSLRPGIQAGREAMHELIAHVLAPNLVPPTLLVALPNRAPFVPGPKESVCSIQLFVSNERVTLTELNLSISTEQQIRRLHHKAMHDLLLANADSHSNNLGLTKVPNQLSLPLGLIVPFDHGLILSTDARVIRFSSWRTLAASQLPVHRDVMRMIERMQPKTFMKTLRAYGVKRQARHLAAARLILLKEFVVTAHLSLADVANVLTPLGSNHHCEFVELLKRSTVQGILSVDRLHLESCALANRLVARKRAAKSAVGQGDPVGEVGAGISHPSEHESVRLHLGLDSDFKWPTATDIS